MRAMSVLVAIAFASEVFLDDLHALKCWMRSIPVSSTATTTPLPVKGEVSAPTAFTPQAISWFAGAASSGRLTGAINFIGTTGAIAKTFASRVKAGIKQVRILSNSSSAESALGGLKFLCLNASLHSDLKQRQASLLFQCRIKHDTPSAIPYRIDKHYLVREIRG